MTKGPRSEYRKNIITLVTGTTLAQAIPVAISPILTRLYTPEDFGVFAIYFSFSMVLSVFATGKYEMAITLPKDDRQSIHLVQLSLSIAGIISLLLLIAVVLLKNQIASGLGLREANVLFFLPISTFLIGLNQSLYYYYNRKKEYTKMATSRVVRSVGYSSSSVLMGVLKANGIGLALSDVLGQVASALTLYLKDRRQLKLFDFNKENLFTAARLYQNFPRFSILSGLLEKLAGQAPVFILNKIFLSSSTVGFFSLAQRTIMAPSELITRAMADVFRQQASEAYALHGECKTIFLATFKRLLIIAILPFMLSFFIIEDAFAWVFGEAWRVAGAYAKIMLPMFFLQFVVSPLSIIFIIAQKQKYDLWMQVFLLSFVSLSFYLGYKTNSVETCLQYFTAIYCLKYLIEFIFSYRFSQEKK